MNFTQVHPQGIYATLNTDSYEYFNDEKSFFYYHVESSLQLLEIFNLSLIMTMF